MPGGRIFQFMFLKSKMGLGCFDFHLLKFNVFSLVFAAGFILSTSTVRCGLVYI